MKFYSILFYLLVITYSNKVLALQNNFQDILRIKIENKDKVPLTAFGEKIYSSKTTAQVYNNLIFEKIWNKQSINDLIKSLEAASDEGLDPNDYHLSILKKQISGYSELKVSETVEIDLLATDAFLLYTSHLLSGKIDPVKLDADWHVSRREGEPSKLLLEAIKNNSVNASIQSCIPKQQTYKSLKKALKMYESIQTNGGWKTIPEGETLKPGAEDKRIGPIRLRLQSTNDLPQGTVKNPDIYDDQFVEAVKYFQNRHGLDNDGVIGKGTVSALNVSVENRITQVKVNLERWRWIPAEFSNYYVLVNIADFSLQLVKNKELIKQYKVITGKNYRKTPVFTSQMNYLVLNPTWTVPPGILNNDILPAVRKNPDYLNTKKLQVLGSDGKLIDPSTIDWNSAAVKSYTYRQPAGPDNALGYVKFMFPNNFSVYIHDTPVRELFNKSERNFSSGCIRLQDPLELAAYLLQGTEWTKEKIDKQIELKQTTTISLKEKPDVYILYWTAWTDRSGVIQFRKDIYERDALVAKALAQKPPTL